MREALCDFAGAGGIKRSGHPPVGEQHDAVGIRRRHRVVSDHHHRVPVLVDDLPAGDRCSYLGRRRDVGVPYRSGDVTQAAIWARELAPSLLRMLRTWLSTVRSEMNRRVPICLLVRPSATSRATSASRLASTPAPASSAAPASPAAGSPSTGA